LVGTPQKGGREKYRKIPFRLGHTNKEIRQTKIEIQTVGSRGEECRKEQMNHTSRAEEGVHDRKKILMEK
jgi:hypothetical protein